MKKAGKTIKNVWLWIAAVVMALLGMGIMPHWSFILALLVAVLIVPVQKWQDVLKKFLPSAVKLALGIGLTIVCFAVMPKETTQTQDETNTVVNSVSVTTTAHRITDVTTTVASTTLVTEGTTGMPANESKSTSVATAIKTSTSKKSTTKAETTTKKATVTTIPSVEKNSITYILNTNSLKFHFQSCASAKKIKVENREVYEGDRETLLQCGYSPCGNCHP